MQNKVNNNTIETAKITTVVTVNYLKTKKNKIHTIKNPTTP